MPMFKYHLTNISFETTAVVIPVNHCDKINLNRITSVILKTIMNLVTMMVFCQVCTHQTRARHGRTRSIPFGMFWFNIDSWTY